MKRLLAFNALAFLLPILCGAEPRGGMESQSLNGDWELSFWRQPQNAVRDPGHVPAEARKVPAKVPGNVEIDLLAAGVIDDPKKGDNIYKLRKYEPYQWMYSREFEAPKIENGQKAYLRFEGIDTFADIFLNGRKIASTDNMLIAHRIPLGKNLKEGKNRLDVIIRSPVLEVQNNTLGAISSAYEFEHQRKAPHMYGWDIMPRLVSAGLWRGVYLDIDNPAKINDVFMAVRSLNLKSGTAIITGVFQFKIPPDLLGKSKLSLSFSKGGKKIFDKSYPFNTSVLRITDTVKNVEAWWPRGYGKPALYDMKVAVAGPDGKILDSISRKFGFRTVELDIRDIKGDDKGEFQFKINGEKIFVKGTNWVPISALHSEDAKLGMDVLKMAADLNCNMIRCWGGNVYEDSWFYDFCDSQGIMVWQDFSFACSTPPQNDEFAKSVAEEVRSVVLKLRNHPCLVLWAGNNENDAQLNWTFRGAFKINPNMERISRRVIPEVLYEFDPTRPYLPSSPYISQGVFEGVAKNPEVHLWGPRGYYKAPYYTSNPAHFVSEIGYHGCPNRESLEKMLSPEFLYPWGDYKKLDFNPQWQAKAVCPFEDREQLKFRNSLMTNQIKHLFGNVPEGLDDFIFASQVVQAEAKKYFIEFWRSQKFDRSGILWWNLRDGWPIISDAIVDYFNSKKLAYEYIKRVQTDMLVLVNDSLELIAVNDTLKPADKGRVAVRDSKSGKLLFEGDFKIAKNAKTLIAKLALPKDSKQGVLLIEYEIGGVKGFNHYLYGNPPFKLDDYREHFKKIMK